MTPLAERARRLGWTHWGPGYCPECGRGISAKYRGTEHPVRVRGVVRHRTNILTAAGRARLAPRTCAYVAPKRMEQAS